MTFELFNLRGVWVAEAASGSYAVPKSFPSDHLAFPYQEGSLNWKLMQRLGDPKTAKQYLDGHDLKVLLQKRASVSLGTTLHSHGVDMTGVSTAPTSSTWALGRVLKALMGGMSARTSGGATTVQAGTTTTVVNVTAGRGADFFDDGVIACQTVSGSTALEAREIESFTANTVTVKEAFSAVPVTGTNVRGGVTFYPTEDPDTSLEMVIEGNESDDRVAIYGLQGGIKLNIPVGAPDGDGEIQLPTMSFDLMGGSWARLSSASPQTLSYSMYEPIANIAAELTMPAFGVTTRVHVDDAAFAIDLALASKAIPTGLQTTGIAENIIRMRRQMSRPLAKGTILLPFEDTTWEAVRTARTATSVYKQIGNLAGGGMLISVPRTQITDVQPADNNSITGQQVSFEGRHDNGSTALGRAVARVHCF